MARDLYRRKNNDQISLYRRSAGSDCGVGYVRVLDVTAREKVSDERIRNYRAWCEARVGSLSGADIGVALCDEVLSLRTSQEWQGIESAPRDGTDILVAYKHCDSWFVHNAFWMEHEEWQDEDEHGWWSYLLTEVSRTRLDGCCEPTHWRPCIPPPKGEAP